MPLILNVLKPLVKSVLIPQELMAGASATEGSIHKKMFATLIVSSKEIYEIMKTVKSLEKSGLLIKGISETIKNEAKEQKGGFIGMSLGT